MSEYVEEPVDVEEESTVTEEVPVEEAPVEEEPVEEAPVEETPVEETPVEEPAPVSTQEVVQNVQEMLTTEPAVSSDSASLEERVKVLEERLESLVQILKYINIDRRKCVKQINEL